MEQRTERRPGELGGGDLGAAEAGVRLHQVVGSTRAGRIACPAFTCSVSPTPSRNAHANSMPDVEEPARWPAPSDRTMMQRARSAKIISRRRSIRSAIAPVNIESSSHGSRGGEVMPAINNGRQVRVAASSGKSRDEHPVAGAGDDHRQPHRTKVVADTASPLQLTHAGESHRRAMLPSQGFLAGRAHEESAH